MALQLVNQDHIFDGRKLLIRIQKYSLINLLENPNNWEISKYLELLVLSIAGCQLSRLGNCSWVQSMPCMLPRLGAALPVPRHCRGGAAPASPARCCWIPSTRGMSPCPDFTGEMCSGFKQSQLHRINISKYIVPPHLNSVTNMCLTRALARLSRKQQLILKNRIHNDVENGNK